MFLSEPPLHSLPWFWGKCEKLVTREMGKVDLERQVPDCDDTQPGPLGSQMTESDTWYYVCNIICDSYRIALYGTIYIFYMRYFFCDFYLDVKLLILLWEHILSVSVRSFLLSWLFFNLNFYFFLILKAFCIGVWPINSVVVVLGKQRRDSAIHIHGSILPQTALPSRLPHNRAEFHVQSVGASWLSILNIAMCTWPSQSPWLSLPSGNRKFIL